MDIHSRSQVYKILFYLFILLTQYFRKGDTESPQKIFQIAVNTCLSLIFEQKNVGIVPPPKKSFVKSFKKLFK